MSQPLVSIIIPTYNVERYVDECIESVLEQQYESTEILVIDDGSSDATRYLLEAYKDKLILQLNEKNKGQGAVRNQAIDQAKGKYLLFVDSDDWIEPDTVTKLVEKAEETQVDLVRFNGVAFFEGSEDPALQKQYDFSHTLEEKVYDREESLKKNQKAYSASPCLYLVKKDLLDEYAIRFPEGVLHEDEYFTTKLFAHVERMTYVNQTFYHRRYRVASTMTEITPAHKRHSFDSYLEVYKQLEKEYQSDKYNPAQKKFIKRQLLSLYNGMMNSPVASILKKDLKQLASITWSDRARVQLSRVRQKLARR